MPDPAHNCGQSSGVSQRQLDKGTSIWKTGGDQLLCWVETSSKEVAESKGVPRLTASQERQMWRKVDMKLIPLVTTMYLVAFVDKTNIGNAKLQGLTSQLQLTGHKFNIILTLNFFVRHSTAKASGIVQQYSPPWQMNCIFAVPANLVLKKMRPSIWLPGITITWGIITTLNGLVKTYPQLLAVRLLLGIAEAGMSPGVLYYLTLWYPRHMLQYRIGLFWGGASFAGAFSGLIAYAISFMSGTCGLMGWSWIFIIEGIVSVVVGVAAFMFFADFPSTAGFLNAEERAYLVHRKTYDNSSVGEDEHFALKHVQDAVLDWQVWATCMIEMSIVIPVYGISLFLPSIINGFGFEPAISQLLSVPPYVLATLMVILWAVWSDKLERRSPFIILGLLLCLIGFVINISSASLGVKYFGTFLVVTGGYAGFPGVPSWLGNNLVGHYKRGVGMAIQAASGQIGGIIASNIYRTQDAPRYVVGHVVELAVVATGLVVVPSVVVIYMRLNAARDARLREVEDKETPIDPETLRALGDRAPDFRYTL
ncbi:MFS general substrate transporter [Pilatotrama ljubarskyi]|nr:MFS general substrate transporter [Pilatotrama ljubarskyi]